MPLNSLLNCLRTFFYAGVVLLLLLLPLKRKEFFFSILFFWPCHGQNQDFVLSLRFEFLVAPPSFSSVPLFFQEEQNTSPLVAAATLCFWGKVGSGFWQPALPKNEAKRTEFPWIRHFTKRDRIIPICKSFFIKMKLHSRPLTANLSFISSKSSKARGFKFCIWTCFGHIFHNFFWHGSGCNQQYSTS